MSKNNFTLVIPARMHSTRLPQKMILKIGDLPMIVQTAKQAMKSNASKVIVATDHEDIIKVCSEHGIEAVMTKVTHNSGTERLVEVTNLLNLPDDEIIINVQGDEPLIDPSLINQLADFILDKKTPIATIAHHITLEDEIFNPNIVKVVLDKDNNALYFSRASIPFYRDGYTNRQEFKQPQTLDVLRHIGIYAYNIRFLKQYYQLANCPLENVECLEQLRILYNGYKIAVMTSDTTPHAGVDTLEDLERIRQLVNSKSSY